MTLKVFRADHRAGLGRRRKKVKSHIKDISALDRGRCRRRARHGE